MSASYPVQYFGACLGSLVENGTMLTASPDGELSPGDVVAVVLASGLDSPYGELINALGRDGYTGMCKIFLGARTGEGSEPVYLVGQVNPPLISPIPRSAIAVMHKVIDAEKACGDRTDELDIAAVRLISQFAGEPASPIGRGFEA